MAAPTAPACIRIKRKRDEPSVPEFVLASKRPSLLDRLSLQPSPPEEKTVVNTPPVAAVRYRLVGTAAARGSAAVRDAAALAAAREQALRRTQGAARYRKLSQARGTAPNDQVLELEACTKADDRSATDAARPKLRPFGPPLPKKPPPPPPEEVAEVIETSSGGLISEADLWADMSAAAEEAAAEVAADTAAAKAADDEDASYVYDEYAVMGEGDAAAAGGDTGSAMADTDAGWAPLEIFWEDEFEDEWAHEPDRDGNDSDSNGEIDYPDEDSDDGDHHRYNPSKQNGADSD